MPVGHTWARLQLGETCQHGGLAELDWHSPVLALGPFDLCYAGLARPNAHVAEPGGREWGTGVVVRVSRVTEPGGRVRADGHGAREAGGCGDADWVRWGQQGCHPFVHVAMFVHEALPSEFIFCYDQLPLYVSSFLSSYRSRQ